MILWTHYIATARPLPSLPRWRVVSSETRIDTSYFFEGRTRGGEDHCLFKYTLGGEGVFRDGAGEHRVGPGSAFLCRIQDPETAYYYPPGGREPWTFVYTCFDGGYADAVVADLVGRYGPVYALPPDGGIMARLLAMRNLPGGSVDVTAAEGARAVNELLLALAESKERQRAVATSSVLVRRARELVREHLRENLNVTDLARLLGISREHLSRVFKAEAGTSPHRFIQREKALLACHLLKETSLTAKEIARDLGFESAARFTRTFRRVMLTTPTAFRDSGVLPPVQVSGVGPRKQSM